MNVRAITTATISNPIPAVKAPLATRNLNSNRYSKGTAISRGNAKKKIQCSSVQVNEERDGVNETTKRNR